MLWLLPIAVFALLYVGFNRFMKKTKLGVKLPGPKGYPFIGAAVEFFRQVKNADDLLLLFSRYAVTFKETGIAEGNLGPLNYVIIFKPEYIEIFTNNTDSSVNKGRFYEFIFGIIGDGVFVTGDVQKWKELKKPLIKCFTKKLITNDYFSVFVIQAMKFVEHIRAKCGKEINVIHEIRCLTTDIFTETHLGVKPNELENRKFRFVENAEKVTTYSIENSTKIIPLKVLKLEPRYPKTIQQSLKDMNAFYEWVFNEWNRNKQYIKDDSHYYTGFLEKRLKEKKLTTNQIYRELADILVAGTDTVAVTLASSITYLSMHPEIQDKAFEEQHSIFGNDHQREPTVEELVLMEYLERIIKETLRIASPPIIYRIAKKDFLIDNYNISNGSIIGIFVENIHNNPEYWERPTEFYPDHFLPESEHKRPPYSYMPFGIGPRICPGRQYAMVMMKTLLSFVLRNFKVTSTIKYQDITYTQKLMKEFKCDYNVTFEERIIN